MRDKLNVEFIFCLALWVFANVYSIYRLYDSLQSLGHVEFNYGGFVSGWTVLNRPKDDSDFEWGIWRNFVSSSYPWLLLNFTLAEICRVKNTQCLPVSYLVVAVCFFLYKFGAFGVIILALQPVLYWNVVTRRPKVAAIWICCFTSFIYVYALNYFHSLHPYNVLLEQFSIEEMYIIMITCSWIQLRCISFSHCLVNSLDKIEDQKKPYKIPFLQCLSYCFYLPLALLGPIIMYEDFEKALTKTNRKSLKQRLDIYIRKISRCTLWFLCVEFSLHFVYFNRLHYDIELLQELPSWALYGGGLWMGLFFYMKYLIFYGIGGALSSLDHVDPPPLPKCIVTVHLYSDMWKNFDVGLYKFLVSYIYKPSIASMKNTKIQKDILKSIGSFLCFAFIYVWHGTHTFILVWTLLNYVGVVVENLATKLSKLSIISKIKNDILKKDSMKARFNALVSSPLLLMSALSNFYFFGGLEFGNHYVNRVFNESISTIFFILLFLYASCFVSAKTLSCDKKKA